MFRWDYCKYLKIWRDFPPWNSSRLSIVQFREFQVQMDLSKSWREKYRLKFYVSTKKFVVFPRTEISLTFFYGH